MNVWMSVYNERKTFSLGNSVFWDKIVLTRAQINELVQEYGPDYFEVLSLIIHHPFSAPAIRIGRNNSFVVKTNPRYLIKVA
jgi:hypothetical protein